ncbi:hypothetical protein LOTGIDRAFT_168021 [Lottia gigantea]|uniref:Protein kinase domain-containing protein n=1 Tax=Lottia gigantea TaxID=225164 RepID=V3ZLN9_LOTGI|nr:hypothetical protein LOTGIDRAFT_168021 [Lottia gigantea]ESO85217.1 hypothetical protein LOTGIDRAFT_168021 [Lottia gigantea]
MANQNGHFEQKPILNEHWEKDIVTIGLVIKGGLQSSQNYTWNDADVLGKGATADVYLGRNKVNGDIVAIKQFRQTHRPGYDVEYREMQLLQKLNHENVIRLFGIEQQSLNGSVVIIMEYCEGGSLHALLDQPQNTYGLSESTFLLVLKHVVKGIQYLQSLEIIHRDIKPGNIMRCFTEQGEVIFKLTDFGAARKLEEEENFTSMYGTEEYLYPAMYETAVLRLPTGQTFDSRVDLWSLGVTFYHCATGKLPFTPHGGRSNRETMFKIISQKETGVISGTQHFENGPITWSRELPHTCLLSSGLKKMLVPLLAGLMETDQHRMINHDQLYDIVTNNICSCIVVKVFHYATCTNLSIYVNSKASLSVLQDSIAEQTEIPASQQILLYMGRLVKHEIDQLAPIETYPKYLLKSQLYVYNSTYTDEIQPLYLPDLPTFPDFKSTYPDYDRDSKIVFQCSSRSYYIKAITDTLVNNQKCLVEGEQFLRSYISSRSMLIDESFNGVVKVLEQSSKRFEVFYNLLKSINRFMDSVFSKSPELEEIVKDVSLISVHKKKTNTVSAVIMTSDMGS